MKRLLALLLIATQAHATDTGYDTLRIDFPAENVTKAFSKCTFYPGNLPTYIIWCDSYPFLEPYVASDIAGVPVMFGTVDWGFTWGSDTMGACRLIEQTDHGTYTAFRMSCYTDRISADGFEP